MLITSQNLSVIIVSYKSDHVIHKCINSIDPQIEIVVVENSNNINFKNEIENKYKNTRCILSNENIGMGAGNNLGIKNIKNDFALILNPDVVLEKDTIEELINASKKIDSFGIISPISNNLEFPNYKLKQDDHDKFDLINPFKVKIVDGYAMLLNLKELKQIENFNFFDENFFLYLENDDLCLRTKKMNEYNEERKSIESKLSEEALDQANNLYSEKTAVVACGEGNEWNPGVVGIVAGKLAHSLGKPCIVLAKSDYEYKGSGRGVPGVNLMNILTNVKNCSRTGGDILQL